MQPRRTHYRSCTLCEAICGLRIEVEDGRITSIRGDEDDPLSRGHICPKAAALPELQSDPDRLRQPLLRTDSGWKQIPWDEALDQAASGLHQIQRAHGRDAVATFLGNPVAHDHGALLFAPQLVRALGSRNRYSAASLDQLPHTLAAHLMLGHQLLVPIPDLDRTGYFLMLGANPLVSNGSIMTAPGMRRRLRELRERGGRLVVVDPRRTETAALADEHLFIRPGTDALFLLALVHEVLAIGARLRHLSDLVDGLDALGDAIRDLTPERSAPHTGIPAGVTRRIAQEFAGAESAVAYGRLGTCTQRFGALCHWAIDALNAVSGNLDRAGGAMFAQPAFDIVHGPRMLSASRGSFDRWRSRVRQIPEVGGELPVATLADEILTEGDGQVRALLTVAGNPVLSAPNGARLDRALGTLGFMVSIDPYLNETTRHANLILPPTTPLERSSYDVPFRVFAVRNTAKYSPALFSPPKGALHDWQILLELRRRLLRLRGRSVAEACRSRALRWLGPDRLVGLGLRLGPHHLGLGRLRREPHGVDLGPLQPCLRQRLPRGGRISLAPAPLVRDLDRLREAFPPTAAERGRALVVIGRRGLRDVNSWTHNVAGLAKGRPPFTLFVNPEDAQGAGLTEGARALVTSRVGHLEAPVHLTDDVMPGVVCLPFGFGHALEGVRLRVASSNPGASLNDLTDDEETDAVSGTAVLSGVRVSIAPAPAAHA